MWFLKLVLFVVTDARGEKVPCFLGDRIPRLQGHKDHMIWRSGLMKYVGLRS